MSQHNSMALLLSQALGGKPEGAPPSADGARDVTQGAGSLEDAMAAINAMLTL